MPLSSYGVGDSVREIWQMDKQRMKDEFNHYQLTNCEWHYLLYEGECVYR